MRLPFDVTQLSGVLLLMLAQVGAFRKRHVTLIALMRLFIQMYLQVALQYSGFGKSFRTDMTDVVQIFRMAHHVHLKKTWQIIYVYKTNFSARRVQNLLKKNLTR